MLGYITPAQLLFNTGLGQERAGYRSQAANAQAQALERLQQAMFQSRFGVEGDRNTLAIQLKQATIANPVITQKDEEDEEDEENKTPNAEILKLLEEIAARQQAGTQSGGGRGNLMDMF